MTVRTPPSFLAASSHPAEDVRRMLHALFGSRGGIVGAGDLAVTQNGTPNMSVNVADGRLVLTGSEATYQGVYVCENRGTTNVAIAAADSTNPRRDLIVARVRDAEYSGATNSFAIEAVTGTPAASPVDPAVPANSWVLARVQVAAGATTITNGVLTDLRTVNTSQFGRAAALGGLVPCNSSFRPPHAVGQPVARTNRTSNSAAFGTSVTYFDTVTATLLPNRKIRVRVAANILAGTAGQTVSLGVATNAGTILNQAYRYWNNPVTNELSCDAQFNSGAGGSLTYKISAFTDTSTATITATGTAYSYIAIYDEGPA